jgi:hypothetical protein
MRQPALTLTFVLFIALSWRPAKAYQVAGHFYSIVSELGLQDRAALPFTDTQMRVISFCAELPDLAKEFDAITTRAEIPLWANVTWGVFSACWSNGVRHMVTTQHYLHALTGLPHDVTLAAGKRTLSHLRGLVDANPRSMEAACALGFATHMLGDSFAHERMDHSGYQYDTGLGHFRDDTRPDHPLVTGERLQMWQHYLAEAGTNLRMALASQTLGTLDTLGARLFPVPAGTSNYDEAGLITGLSGAMGPERATLVPYGPPLEDLNAGEYLLSTPCEAVVQQYGAALGTTFDCRAAWQTYLNVVGQTFATAPAACPAPTEEN